MNKSEDWIEEFWTGFDPSEDDGVSAIRLIYELLAGGVIMRDGDNVEGRSYSAIVLSAEDQFLVRRIAKAAGVESE